MKPELIKEIDLIIEELIEIGVISNDKCNSELRKEAIRFLKANDLLKKTNKPSQYNPKSEIYEIKKIGIETYLIEKDTYNAIDKKIKKKTLFNLNNKYFINFCFVVLSSFLAWFFTSKSESKTHKQTIEKQHKVISEKTDSLVRFQILLNGKNTLILSLKKELDSLKSQ